MWKYTALNGGLSALDNSVMDFLNLLGKKKENQWLWGSAVLKSTMPFISNIVSSHGAVLKLKRLESDSHLEQKAKQLQF